MDICLVFPPSEFFFLLATMRHNITLVLDSFVLIYSSYFFSQTVLCTPADFFLYSYKNDALIRRNSQILGVCIST